MMLDLLLFWRPRSVDAILGIFERVKARLAVAQDRHAAEEARYTALATRHAAEANRAASVLAKIKDLTA